MNSIVSNNILQTAFPHMLLLSLLLRAPPTAFCLFQERKLRKCSWVQSTTHSKDPQTLLTQRGTHDHSLIPHCLAYNSCCCCNQCFQPVLLFNMFFLWEENTAPWNTSSPEISKQRNWTDMNKTGISQQQLIYQRCS